MRIAPLGAIYVDRPPFDGDSVAHGVGWKDKSIESLEGKVLRLEILLHSAEVFAFLATGRKRYRSRV